MGLVEGTAIVTAAEVAEITHEDGLANLNGTSATIDNSCKWATTYLIDELDAKGIPVDKIANVARLKRAAAYWSAADALMGTSSGDEAVMERAKAYFEKAAELLEKYRFVSTDAPGDGTTNLTLPTVGNQDSSAVFGRSLPGEVSPNYPPPFLP